MNELEEAVTALNAAFPGAKLLDIPGRLIVWLPEVSLGDAQWAPQKVPALLVCDGWPQQRPQLLVADALRRNGVPPTNFSGQYIYDRGWFSYSFQAPYDASHPVLVAVVRGWLRRFDGRSD